MRRRNRMAHFINVDAESTCLSPVYGYHDRELLPLSKALDPVKHQMKGIDTYIRIAKTACHFPSEHGLTQEESAAIYIYTMDWDDCSLYRLLNAELRIEDRSLLKPWFDYLKLFDTALQKLPNHEANLWRGIGADITQNYRKDMQLTWWNFTSCSSSLAAVESFLGSESPSTLLMVEAKHGKSVSKYSSFPKEYEIILSMGSRVCVSDNPLQTERLNVIHLKEVHDEHPDDVSSTLAALNVDKTVDTAAREYPSIRQGSFLIEYPDLSTKNRAGNVRLWMF